MKHIISFTYALDFNDWKEKGGVLLGAAKKEGILKEVVTSLVERIMKD